MIYINNILFSAERVLQMMGIIARRGYGFIPFMMM